MKRFIVSDTDNLGEVENKILADVGRKFELQRGISSPSIHIITI